MIIIKHIICCFLITAVLSCTPSTIEISANFDHGSIGPIEEIEPGYIQGLTKHWYKRDGVGDQYYWFYFKADGFKQQKLTFELGQLKGVYRNKPHLIYNEQTQPVYSYDREQWKRIETVSYDSANQKLIFSHEIEKAPVWIAYAHPYPYIRFQSFVSKVVESEFVEVEQVAKSKEGRPIQLLTVTDPNVAEDSKKTIALIALQHSGEDAGGFYLEGLINFLISDDEDAKKARSQFNFKLIPMMNPDGIFGGSTRYNMEMEDLNNIWFSEEKMQPEVAGVQKWTDHWLNLGKTIELFIDVHSHTQFYTYNVFIFNDTTMNNLRTVMNKYWPARVWHSEPVGSAHAYFHSLGIRSGSLELTQSFSEKGDYLNIPDYHRYGEQTVRGLIDYFGSASEF